VSLVHHHVLEPLEQRRVRRVPRKHRDLRAVPASVLKGRRVRGEGGARGAMCARFAIVILFNYYSSIILLFPGGGGAHVQHVRVCEDDGGLAHDPAARGVRPGAPKGRDVSS
jgi:hypothetical protein